MRVTISIPKVDLGKVDALAKKLTIPRSAVVRIAIAEYLRRRPKL